MKRSAIKRKPIDYAARWQKAIDRIKAMNERRKVSIFPTSNEEAKRHIPSGKARVIPKRGPVGKPTAKAKPSLRRTAIRKAGKRTKIWDQTRAKLKVGFERAGITVCELAGLGCWRDNGLGFAHSLKRRNIKDAIDLCEVILACNVCHDAIERLPEEHMARVVRSTIEARPRQVIL